MTPGGVVRGMDASPDSDPVFRIAAIVATVAGAAVVIGVLWAAGPVQLPGPGYWLVFLLQLGLVLCTPVTHLVGGALMLLRGSVATATITALVTTGGTLLVGVLAIVTIHPLFVAPAVTGVAVIGLLLWAVFRVPQEPRPSAETAEIET
jgi:hypothetical protein